MNRFRHITDVALTIVTLAFAIQPFLNSQVMAALFPKGPVSAWALGALVLNIFIVVLMTRSVLHGFRAKIFWINTLLRVVAVASSAIYAASGHGYWSFTLLFAAGMGVSWIMELIALIDQLNKTKASRAIPVATH